MNKKYFLRSSHFQWKRRKFVFLSGENICDEALWSIFLFILKMKEFIIEHNMKNLMKLEGENIFCGVRIKHSL